MAAFDALFLSIQLVETLFMDPQQRLMLETSYRHWSILEPWTNLRVPKFVRTSSPDYETSLLRDPDQPTKYIGTGIGTSLLANRDSWFFNLKGPNIAIDRACSGFYALAEKAAKKSETRRN